LNELTLQTGPYRTTFIGTEIVRQSTKDEWENYGEILRRVDEAKQWAIGDWLVDGKRHYGDGVYKEASEILDVDEQQLRRFKMLSSRFELLQRCNNLSYAHHYEVASIKRVEVAEDGTLNESDDTDYEKISEFLSKAEKEGLSVRELREKVSIYKAQQKEKIRLVNEPEKYSVIYADPPWEYPQDWDYFGQNVKRHYQTMTDDELKNFPIKNIRANDCVLYMWATAPKLDIAIEVLKSWGFDYKTCLVWDKVGHNMGFYASIRHEFLLVGGYGQSAPQDKSYANRTDSVYVEQKTYHSRKPEYYYEMIEKMHPHKTKRIELFARIRHEGWDSWGIEV